MDSELKVELGFVQRRLPWLLAAGVFVVYLATLHYSPTFASISALGKALGWDWRSNVVAPLHMALIHPIRWLPAAIQMAALNLEAAVAAALAIGLLARSVALLPHDRTREQRGLERNDHSFLSIPAAWIPPTLAALVCAFQLSLWENAVAATGEALDLLLFAWLVHSLLMLRLDEKESRLRWFALVYGVAITNNYAMIPLAGPFLAAVIWIRGLRLLRPRLLIELALLLLAGLSLYLVLPLVESHGDFSGFTFWELLKSYWGYQKSVVLGTPRYIILFSAFTSLVPALFMGIRWPAQFGESSAAGNALTNLMTHVLHGVFLVACVYVAFDPPFSPRSLSAETYAMLPVYYLGALAAGYCSGYFLLVFGAKGGPHAWQQPSPLRKLANRVVVTALWLALPAVPIGLLVQNLPTMRANAGSSMARLSEHTVRSLPGDGVVILSEDPFRLHSLKDRLRQVQPGNKHLFIDTTQLPFSGYHAYLKRMYGDRWPMFNRPADPKAFVDSVQLIELLGQLSSQHPLVYLHPSFGYYFEAFYAKPLGPIYQLLPYTDPLVTAPPALTAAELQAQDAFWRSLLPSDLEPLMKQARPFRKLSRSKPRTKTLQDYMADGYSRSLTDFGVTAQRSGNPKLATACYELALRLNDGNAAAFVNREYSAAYQAGKHVSYKLSDGGRDRIETAGGRWDRILAQQGPTDEPGACLYLAGVFQNGMNFRQASQNLERTLHYDPDSRSTHINYMLMCVKALLPDLALKQLAVFRAQHPQGTLKEEEELDLISIEAWAKVVRNDLPAAETLLLAAQQKYPKQAAPFEALTDIYMNAGQGSNATVVLERQLKLQPDSNRALVNYAVSRIQLNQPQQALPYLERALKLKPQDDAALLNRAIAYLKLAQLDAAERDLLTLRSSGQPGLKLKVLYYLADVAFQKKNRTEALRLYKELLKELPAASSEGIMFRQRIKMLEDSAAL